METNGEGGKGKKIKTKIEDKLDHFLFVSLEDCSVNFFEILFFSLFLQ